MIKMMNSKRATFPLLALLLLVVISTLVLNRHKTIENLQIPLADAPVNMEIAGIVMTWQLDNGGWMKQNANLYTREWDGEENKNSKSGIQVEYGSIKGGTTVDEIRYLIKVYNNTKDKEVKTAIFNALDFIEGMQYDSGAFPQLWPAYANKTYDYLNDATFNDDSMVQVLELYRDLLNDELFNSRVLNKKMLSDIEEAYLSGIDYVLNAQVVVDGKLTAWCQQHDPYNYEPVGGRKFEPVSLSGFETIDIILFLQNIENEVDDNRIGVAIDSAIDWLDTVRVENKKYYRYGKNGEYFVDYPGRNMWYRFYEIDSNKGFFTASDGTKTYDIKELEQLDPDKLTGYMWAGPWGNVFFD